MTNDSLRKAAHDLHNHLHALEMGLLALTASDQGVIRQQLAESLQEELRGAKSAAQQLVREAGAD